MLSKEQFASAVLNKALEVECFYRHEYFKHHCEKGFNFQYNTNYLLVKETTKETIKSMLYNARDCYADMGDSRDAGFKKFLASPNKNLNIGGFFLVNFGFHPSAKGSIGPNNLRVAPDKQIEYMELCLSEDSLFYKGVVDSNPPITVELEGVGKVTINTPEFIYNHGFVVYNSEDTRMPSLMAFLSSLRYVAEFPERVYNILYLHKEVGLPVKFSQIYGQVDRSIKNGGGTNDLAAYYPQQNGHASVPVNRLYVDNIDKVLQEGFVSDFPSLRECSTYPMDTGYSEKFANMLPQFLDGVSNMNHIWRPILTNLDGDSFESLFSMLKITVRTDGNRTSPRTSLMFRENLGGHKPISVGKRIETKEEFVRAYRGRQPLDIELKKPYVEFLKEICPHVYGGTYAKEDTNTTAK